MNIEPFVNLVLKKGVANANISMLPPEQQKQILEMSARILIERGYMEEAVIALKRLNTPEAKKALENIAKNAMDYGNFEKALEFYEFVGNQQMIELIRKNLLKG